MVIKGNESMKGFLFGLLLLSGPVAGARDYSIGMDYACLSLDGTPIAKGSDQAAKCCVASPGPECRIGFSSVVPAAAEDSKGYLDVARAGIKNAAVLNGIDLDHRDPNQTTTLTNVASPSNSAALVADSRVDSEGQPALSGAMGPPGPGSSARNGSSSGSSSGYGGGISGANGASGGTRGREAGGGFAEDFGGGKYLGGAPGDARTGVDPRSVDVSLGDVSELRFGASGEPAKKGPGSSNPDGSDSEGMSGSKEDSPDYLNRIDKAASIFKIVSKRYEKELARNRLRLPDIK